MRVGVLCSQTIWCKRSTVSGAKSRSTVSLHTRAGTCSMMSTCPCCSRTEVTVCSSKVSCHTSLLIGGSPHFVIDPTLRIRFVQGDDLHQRTRGIAALNVQRAVSQGHAEHSAAWPIFVRGIVLDD